ncbi:MAG TPA: DUF2778 domain-containing protein [Paraburkholderia sp.]|jgi:hypothetical protein|nr:DUF2778 domain-containing protein [Paraburkholderia sp.]
MPVQCTYWENGKTTSRLFCSGFGSVEAFSGTGPGRNNPRATAMANIGPLPSGRYYLVDRQSGGRLGWLWDWLGTSLHVTTDHSKWFMLWHERTGDSAFVEGIRRGSFRLHPAGPQNLSKGCITVVSPAQFDLLQRYIRSRVPDKPVPGQTFNAYGTVDVQ